MLTIKDLSASKELDHNAMTEVRGAGNVYSINEQASFQASKGGLVSITESKQAQLSENNAIDLVSIDKTWVGIGSFGF